MNLPNKSKLIKATLEGRKLANQLKENLRKEEAKKFLDTQLSYSKIINERVDKFKLEISDYILAAARRQENFVVYPTDIKPDVLVKRLQNAIIKLFASNKQYKCFWYTETWVQEHYDYEGASTGFSTQRRPAVKITWNND